jgi:hypothetical protein
MWFGHNIYTFKVLSPLFKNTTSLVFKNKKNNVCLYFIYKSYLTLVRISNKIKLSYIVNLCSYLFFSYLNNNILYLKYIINNFIKIQFKFFFKKIKFKGKGYYFFKNKNNNIAFQLNYSHKVNYYNNNTYIFNFSKVSWLFISINHTLISTCLNKIVSLRIFNPFTKRGVRFHKKIMYIKKK